MKRSTEIDVELGEEIRKARLRRGLSIRKAGAELGISPFCIWEAEEGFVRSRRALFEAFIAGSFKREEPKPPKLEPRERTTWPTAPLSDLPTERPTPDVVRLLAHATSVDDVRAILRMASASGLHITDLI